MARAGGAGKILLLPTAQNPGPPGNGEKMRGRKVQLSSSTSSKPEVNLRQRGSNERSKKTFTLLSAQKRRSKINKREERNNHKREIKASAFA